MQEYEGYWALLIWISLPVCSQLTGKQERRSFQFFQLTILFYQEMNAAASGVGQGAAGYGGHGASAGGRPGGGGGGAPGKPVKVVLCQQYSQAGNCERGEACQFAHGLQELHYYRARQVRGGLLSQPIEE